MVSIEGPPGGGKTRLATESTPGKVALFSTDHRWDGLIQKFPDWEQRIAVEDYVPQVDLSADALFQDAFRTEKDSIQHQLADKAATQQSEQIDATVWRPFRRDYTAALADDAYRTLVWDQADELDELLRLVNFGKLTANPQLNYGPVNQEYKGLIKRARVSGKILILIHQMKKVYEEKVFRGYERRWNHNAGYLIDSFVRQEQMSDGSYRTTILQAKLNPAMNGVPMSSPSWEDLMSALAPDVPVESWR